MVDESLKQYFKTHLKSADSILAVGNSSDKDNLSSFFNPYEEVEIHKGNLPHWQQKNVWYFVTFRLADSLPAETVEQIKEERERWLNLHKKEDNKPYSVEELKEYYRLFSERIEKLLDNCRGSCVLREEKIAKIVADALLYFNNVRYEMDDWVIMPNHVHVLVKPHNDSSLVDILHSWKSFTANEINKASSGKGQLWLHESYDHIVRNEKAFYVIKNYIRNNPSKAKIHLPNCAQSWTYHHAAESNSTVYDGEYVFDGGTVIKSKDALDTLEVLFSNEEHTNPFDKSTTERLVALIDSLRVVDPAVGSGAFPMRILNRLVFLLHKLDPDNTLWKQSQIDGIKKSVKDPTLQRQFIEQIERKFSDKNPDYGRKLYLIEKCIYGVDIQQIAVEIAKLRFFISLLVDEKISENSEIEPLPNLDFKLMQGNSLISSFAGIDFNTKPVNDDNLFEFDDNYKRLIEDFEELKSQYQNEPDVKKKDKLRDAIDDKLIEIFEEKLKQHYPQLKTIEENAKSFPGEKQKQEYLEAEKKKLFKKIGIDLDQAEQDLIAYTEGRKQKDFFLWDVYFAEVFAEKDGFDIVIGNPPYAVTKKNTYEKLDWEGDLYTMFFELSIKTLLQKEGTLSFITPRFFLFNQVNYEMRRYFLNELNIISMTECNPFEAVTENEITILTKERTKSEEINFFIHSNDEISFLNTVKKNWIRANSLYEINPYLTEQVFCLLQKIKNYNKFLGQISLSKRGAEIGKNELRKSSKGKTILLGYDVDKYLISPTEAKIETSQDEYHRLKKIFQQSRILLLRRVSKDLISAVPYNSFAFSKNLYGIVPTEYFSEHFLCVLLNSKLLNFYYKKKFSTKKEDVFPEIQTYLYEQLPIKKISIANQKPFIEISSKIHSVKQQNPQAATKHLEDQIDIMVFKLYELTYDEVKVIDPEIENIISKEEYEKVEIK